MMAGTAGGGRGHRGRAEPARIHLPLVVCPSRCQPADIGKGMSDIRVDL